MDVCGVLPNAAIFFARYVVAGGAPLLVSALLVARPHARLLGLLLLGHPHQGLGCHLRLRLLVLNILHQCWGQRLDQRAGRTPALNEVVLGHRTHDPGIIEVPAEVRDACRVSTVHE